MSPLDARAARRRFVVLTGMRWLPTGMLIPVVILLMQDRGLSLAQIGLAGAAQGALILLLELPTGGLADAIGRKPVLLVATVFDIAAVSLLFVADALWTFVVVFALQGIYRALDSGPLDAWYVDAALAVDPDADIETGLSAGGTALGVGVAAGALASGGVVWLDPLSGIDALAVPVLLAIALRLVEVACIATLIREQRPAGRGLPGSGGPAGVVSADPGTPAGSFPPVSEPLPGSFPPIPEPPPGGLGALRASIRQVPSVIGDALRLVKGSTVLLALVSVELFWGFGMVTFENLLPPKLAEVVGNADEAAAILGPASASAWLVSAGGAALVPFATRRFGAPLTAASMRILQGATVVAMGLFAGPVGVLIAYLATYAVHGASNPVHKALLHRQVTSEHRTTVLSVNSMMGMPAAALGGVMLGWLADSTSVSTAMIVGGVILALAAPLYIPAARAARVPPAASLTSQ